MGCFRSIKSTSESESDKISSPGFGLVAMLLCDNKESGLGEPNSLLRKFPASSLSVVDFGNKTVNSPSSLQIIETNALSPDISEIRRETK